MRTPTLLFIDSGIGGLSIYQTVQQRLPQLNMIYLCDHAGFPYGDKSDQVVIHRIDQLVHRLTERYTIDMVIVACNTASTLCLPQLRAHYTQPIIGVVPAIKVASAMSQNRCVGLLATKGTLSRPYTQQLIENFRNGCDILTLGLSELAWMAEQKLQGTPVDQAQLEILFQPWLTRKIQPDTVVLGCTHYPFLQPEFNQLFPQTCFIDSSEAIARRVASLLESQVDLSLLCKNNPHPQRLFISTLALPPSNAFELFQFTQFQTYHM